MRCQTNMISYMKRSTSPDKGWSWVMFACTCVNMFLIFGVHYTYGILYPSLLKEFKSGEGNTAWVGSLSSGLLFLSSALAVKCCEKLSVTTTCIMGSLLSGTGLILTSVIKEFYWLYLVYGVFFGVGTSFMYTPGLIMIAKWFKKYQTTTTGICAACGTLGAVVLSPLIQYMISVNGLRHAIRSAGILYICLALLSSLSYRKLEMAENLTKNLEVHTCKQKLVQEVQIEDGRNKENCEAHTDQQELVQEIQIGEGRKKSFRINLNLFKNKSYLMFVLIMFMTNFIYYIPIIHLVNYAEIHINVSQASSSLLISIWSISNILGRVFFGRMANNPLIRPHLLRMYQVSMFFSGVVTLVTYFATKYWMLIGYVVCYGFLDGSFIGTLSLVTLDIVGMDDLAQGFGIMLTSIGVPTAIGPYLIGVINDANILPANFMFIMAGAPFVIGSVLMILVIKWKKDETSRHDIEEEEAVLNLESCGNIEYVTAL